MQNIMSWLAKLETQPDQRSDGTMPVSSTASRTVQKSDANAQPVLDPFGESRSVPLPFSSAQQPQPQQSGPVVRPHAPVPPSTIAIHGEPGSSSGGNTSVVDGAHQAQHANATQPVAQPALIIGQNTLAFLRKANESIGGSASQPTASTAAPVGWVPPLLATPVAPVSGAVTTIPVTLPGSTAPAASTSAPKQEQQQSPQRPESGGPFGGGSTPFGNAASQSANALVNLDLLGSSNTCSTSSSGNVKELQSDQSKKQPTLPQLTQKGGPDGGDMEDEAEPTAYMAIINVARILVGLCGEEERRRLAEVCTRMSVEDRAGGHGEDVIIIPGRPVGYHLTDNNNALQGGSKRPVDGAEFEKSLPPAKKLRRDDNLGGPSRDLASQQ
ncbi:hypothetical protein HK097_006122 [Rhizophlyctis rosea]|uniref:Uncharacterized protein n=1 Tax=Rhizophlyctis rosea TaxID=64517 RepID=A0AAD5SG54_9FUNG|nr:hypothetical protein HK097_006122 [Rhizophlyctis rosea]